MVLELLAARHHRRAPGDAQIRLPQPHAVGAGQAIEPLDRRMGELGVGREGDGLGRNGSVHRHPFEALGQQSSNLSPSRCANGSDRSARAGTRPGKTQSR